MSSGVGIICWSSLPPKVSVCSLGTSGVRTQHLLFQQLILHAGLGREGRQAAPATLLSIVSFRLWGRGAGSIITREVRLVEGVEEILGWGIHYEGDGVLSLARCRREHRDYMYICLAIRNARNIWRVIY